MILSKMYNSLSPSKREDLVCGLVMGLFWGLFLGLVWGLVLGLVMGLFWGLFLGLVLGLVWGLLMILVNWSEALPFLTHFYPILLLILGIIILSEILFWLMPKEKVKAKNLFWHTCKRKIENIFEVLMGLSAIAQIYIFTRELAKYYNIETTQFILKWIGYIGVGIIGVTLIVGVFYVWIKLNSLKYTKFKEKTK